MSRKKKSKKQIRKPQNQEVESPEKKAQELGVIHWT